MQGLRGIAAIFVVSSHVCLCFWTFLIPPTRKETSTYLFQRPFFRLVIQGNAWVAVFFVLLGFVNSLKTVQLARAGAVNDAFNSLVASIYRRACRMVLPAAAVTVLSWLLCQLGAYRLAYQTDSFWLTKTSPRPSTSWISAIGDLIHELVRTWTEAANVYDQPQWTLLHLFKGALYVILTLLATVKASPTFRIVMEIVLYLWCWKTLDRMTPSIPVPGSSLANHLWISIWHLHLCWNDPSRVVHDRNSHSKANVCRPASNPDWICYSRAVSVLLSK